MSDPIANKRYDFMLVLQLVPQLVSHTWDYLLHNGTERPGHSALYIGFIINESMNQLFLFQF